MGRADRTAARGDGRFLRRFAIALGPVAAKRSGKFTRLSASYLIALGARVVREVGDLFVVRKRRANAWRPWGWIPRFASGR